MPLVESHAHGRYPKPTDSRRGATLNFVDQMPHSRILFLAGPGDCAASARHWSDGVASPSQSFQTYTAETLNFARESGAKAWIISSHPRRDDVDLDGRIRVTNIPRRRFGTGSGAWFHAGEVWRALTVAVMAMRFRADTAVVDSGTFHWFLCWLFRIQGIRVYASFHNTIYPAGHPPRKPLQRAIFALNSHFLRRGCSGATFLSEECERQFVELAGRPAVASSYVGIYDSEEYDRVAPPDFECKEVTVVYSGRIEEDKGVFDLLQATRKVLCDPTSRPVNLIYCGEGAALTQLREQVEADPLLRRRVQMLGRLDRAQLLEVYGRSHFFVVPTTGRFTEGFAMVCAEAVLCGRPFIATDTVPGRVPLAAACLSVKADNVDGLAVSILELSRDRDLYLRLSGATAELRTHFCDPGNGLAAAFHRILKI